MIIKLNVNENKPKQAREFICHCGKDYKDYSGLRRDKKVSKEVIVDK